MNDVIFKSDDLLVMNLLNYFITEEDYNPMIIHGVNNEIWLENMEKEYKIIRIISHHIHNKEQLNFDKFKLNRIIKEVKKKTLSFKIKVLNIYIDVEDKNLLYEEDICLEKDEDIKESKLVSYFPNIVDKTKRDKDGLDFVINVTENINKTNERRNEMAKKIFTDKKPIITYIFSGIYFAFSLILLLTHVDKNFILDLLFLFINTYALYLIGSEVENLYGKWKFLLIYLFSGICGILLQIAFTRVIFLGISGPIFGLLGSILYFGYYYRPYLGSTVIRNILPVIIINLVLGIVLSSYSIPTDIGGLIGGLFITMAVGVPGKNKKFDHINGIILSIIYLIFIIYMAFYL